MWPSFSGVWILAKAGAACFFGGIIAFAIRTSLLPAVEDLVPGILVFFIVISCLVRISPPKRIILACRPHNPPWYVCKKSFSLPLRHRIPQNLALLTLYG